MGVRITRSAPRKTHSNDGTGCLLKIAAATASGLILLVSACLPTDDSKPSQPPYKADMEKLQYRNCVNVDRRQTTQDTCQRHVWGQTFGEDDPRWDCAHMGNWSCGPINKREKQEGN